MTIENYFEYKKQILNKIDELYKNNEMFEVIKLLENSELDFDLCMQLVRAYINLSNAIEDNFSIKQKANTLLDKFAIQGAHSAKWQFYKGYLLYKDGLIQDSLVRFEEALKVVDIADSSLFKNINLMIENAKAQVLLTNFKGVDDNKKNIILKHIESKFGRPNHLCSFNGVDIYQIAPNEKHNYNLLVSVGLSGKHQLVSSTDVFEDIELCFALKPDYQFTQDENNNFEVYMLIEIIKNLIIEKQFIGFGYYLDRAQSFSNKTAFTGAMLCGLGDYDKDAQSIKIDDKNTVIFYELLPLRPMEVNYRKSHSAVELLDLFKQNLVMITPFIPTRDDVCAMVNKA